MVTKTNTRDIAEKFHVYNKSKVTDIPIIEAIKSYERLEEEKDNIIPYNNDDGDTVKPYKLVCNYFRYFGVEHGDKLIDYLEKKYSFPKDTIPLLWQLRNLGTCETYAKDRLLFLMYVLTAEQIPFDSQLL